MKAYGYIRVSTDRQDLGPEAQRQAIERWATANGADIMAVYEDIGVSGGAALDERPGLMAAIEALEAGAVLVAAKRDRLARDVMNAAMIERLAERAGAKVVTADGVGIGDGPEAGLFRHIIDAFSEYERMVIRSRTKAALLVKSSKGEHVGRVPFGFRMDHQGGRLIPDQEEFEVLTLAADLRASGLTLQGVAGELNARGIRTRSGAVWYPAGVRNLLLRAERQPA